MYEFNMEYTVQLLQLLQTNFISTFLLQNHPKSAQNKKFYIRELLPENIDIWKIALEFLKSGQYFEND